MLKNNREKQFLFFKVLFLYTIITTGNASGQYIITTLRCDSTITNCDTLSTEFYNAQKKLERKWKNGNPASSIEYLYREQGVLYRKIHRNQLGEIQKTNRIYSDSSGSWHTDSLIDKNGTLLFVFRRTPTPQENKFQVEWFYKNDTKASSRQLIQYDSLGNEWSNSTCYTNDNCVTYRFIYSGTRKIKSEMWVLEGTSSSPVLKETEEYYYAEDDLAIGSVRFAEPEHICTSRFKYIISRR
ncbi:MAG: hypothetical protein IPP46_10475 [Bacteroidetes bacterium]|nr:hypothetical protein [Bacteroidota bacterium]